MRAIIVANGSAAKGENYQHLVRIDDWVIAADGGASVALKMGLHPRLVVGDLDSLPARLRSRLEKLGCSFVLYPARKDETDTELAIRYALAQGAEEIVLLGATGGRLDHTLANVFLLGLPALGHVRARIVAGGTQIWLLRGGQELELPGEPGDTVTLLPLGQDAVGITTTGLEWALQNDTLPFGPARGVSNVLVSSTARVALREGLLLVFQIRQAVV
ncbi:MAG: thiamine diphosphokinase [Chloroflexi bacterium]|nr:thiamine diphosphokinase [Chloroflexota bacterium]